MSYFQSAFFMDARATRDVRRRRVGAVVFDRAHRVEP
jgi:hypothetical protein